MGKQNIQAKEVYFISLFGILWENALWMHYALTFAQEQGQLSTSQKQAMITLLEKKDKHRTFIKNWWPISLINVDVNIAPKPIARRLESILPELIHPIQNGFIKGRSIL